MTYSFYKKADGVILAFDTTDNSSFNNIQNWVDGIENHASQGIPKILVGNKIDLTEERKITKQQAEL